MKVLIMKLHSNVNMNLNGLAVLLMLSLIVSILIGIENFSLLNMRLLDVRVRMLIMYFLLMSVVKAVIQ
nr:MAG TPA: hypothetical protein [Caudoviricetes sp.]